MSRDVIIATLLAVAAVAAAYAFLPPQQQHL
jgi:hypothetical protein